MSVRLGLIGAGTIGRRHIMAIDRTAEAELAAIADPGAQARELADGRAVPCWSDALMMLQNTELDGVIIATPTQRHHEDVLCCLAEGKHLLVEKPVAATDAQAQDIVSRAEQLGCHVLVGHQRRYYPCAAKAKEMIENGVLGRLMGMSGQWAVRKDDAYYVPEWRRLAAAGPILTNLIHEIDLLRYICGEITSISAHLNHADQKAEKEDAAAVTMQFASQAVGTFFLSDRAASPYSWEAALGENLSIPKSGQNAVRFMGTEATLDFPKLRLWRYDDSNAQDWTQPLVARDIETEFIDAYIAQIEHFCAVIRGQQTPIVTARDGMMSLRATLAVARSAADAAHISLI